LARIYCAEYLVPCDAPPIPGGALLDSDGVIKAVGRRDDVVRANPGVEVVDFPDALLLPMLVNAHTHLELTDFPLWAAEAGEAGEPEDFVDWILRLIRVKRGLGKADYSKSLQHGIQQSIAAGTGAVGDILSQHASRKAYHDSLLHGVLFLESLGQDPEIISRFRQELRAVLAEEQVGQMRLGLSPHSPYTISPEYLHDIFEKCQNQKLPCTTHLAESAAEVEFLVDSRGDLADKLYPFIGWEYLLPEPKKLRPAEYLQRQGGLFPGNLLVHGVQLSPSEIEILAQQRMTLVLCPRSNARLKVGKAPVRELQAAGVSLCLGTDSRASSDSLSIWDELAFAHSWFAGVLDAPTLLRMATINGSAALGLEAQLGSLVVGKMSAFQVLQPSALPKENEIYEFLASPGRSAEVAQVYLQGNACLSGLL